MASISDKDSSSIEVISLRSTLPVLVSESLAVEKDDDSVSVRFFKNNSSALIAGRHLFVWNYGLAGNKKGGASACRKLTLPVSDLTHKADLVHLVEHPNSNMIGCLVVSPEGVMRYWSTLHQEDSYTETSANYLKGEECSQLVSCFPGVFLLATRSGSLVLIDTRTSDESISYRVVGRGSGLLSGLGRRMSSFFTMSAVSSSPSVKLNRICSRIHPTYSNACQVLALNDKQLQIWSFGPNLDEKHESTLNISQSIRDHVAVTVWSTEAYRLRDLTVKLLDCDVRANCVYILALAVTSEDANPIAHFFLCVFDLENEKIDYCSEFKVDDEIDQSQHSALSYSAGDSNGTGMSPDYRLALPSDDPIMMSSSKMYPCLFAAIYCSKWLRIIQVMSGEESSKLVFTAANDRLMGVGPGQSGETLLLFSQAHNLLSVGHHAAQLSNQSFGGSFQRPHLPSSTRLNIFNQSNQSLGVQSFTSFIDPSKATATGDKSIPEASGNVSDLGVGLNQIVKLFWMGYKVQCRHLANDLLASIKSNKFDTNLDHAVIKLARTIMNQKPLQDPRWRQAFKEELSSEVHAKDTSLIQSNQIIEKLSSLHKLQDLLQFTELTTVLVSLSNADIEGTCLPDAESRTSDNVASCEGDSTDNAPKLWSTQAHLEELGEITVAMLTFYQIYSKESCSVVDEALSMLISSRYYPQQVFELLRHVDLLYAEVSLLPSFIRNLCHHWETVYQEVMSKRNLPGQKLAYSSSQGGEKSSKLFELLAIMKYLAKYFVSFLREVSRHRDQRLIPLVTSDNHSTMEDKSALMSCWVTSKWPAGIKKEILSIFESLLVFGESMEDSECCTRANELASLLLYFMQQRVNIAESLRPSPTIAKLKKDYEEMKQCLIRPLAYRLGRVNQALKLAEDHCQFDLMIRLCEENGDIDRLKAYMYEYKERGFQEFAVSWFVKEGKRGQLQHLLAAASAQERNIQHSNDVAPKSNGLLHLLEGEEVRDIGWLHHVQIGNFTKASLKLLDLGSQEQRFIGKKKTLLSLAKLTHFAGLAESDSLEDGELKEINKNLEIIKAQEELSRGVCEQVLSMEPGPSQPFLSVSQIIRLCVTDYEDSTGELQHPSILDFKKAVDLLKYLSLEEERQELMLHVWSKALLMEDWSNLTSMDTIEAFHGVFFYRISSILRADNVSLEEFLPSLETLVNCEQLGTLKDDIQFQYYLKAVYELIQSEFHDQNDFVEQMVVS